ncbi:MAG: DUF6785 family protein [Phycisphaeraceae bacterium]
MTLRALVITAVLVLVICGLGFFNQHVAQLPGMIGGALPLVVFATLAVFVLAVNPLLARLSPRAPLSGQELAVIVCLSLGVCAYTGSSFFRYFGSMTTMPAHAVKTRPAWQSAEVMAYVPGHVGRVAPGQLLDPAGLARAVVAEREADTVAGRLWWLAGEADRRVWREAAEVAGDGGAYRDRLARLVNQALAEPGFLDQPVAGEAARVAAGRRALQAALPEMFARPPPGQGVLLNDGMYDSELMDGFLFGDPAGTWPSVGRVPWDAWWPVIRLWGGLMVLLVVAAICLAVIVRPQWAEHERLAFPIVKFAQLMLERRGGGTLPDIARSRLFWVGFSVTGLHLVNGLHAWFPSLPHLPMQLDFSALRVLFPNASRAWQSNGVFTPTVNLTVIAFAFLLPRAITLTFGLTNVVFLAMFAMLVGRGMRTNDAEAQVGFEGMVNFGAMVALAGVLLYTGRRYYGSVATSAVLGRALGATPAASVWALRALFVLVPLAVGHIVWHGGSPLFATLAVGLVLLLWVVNARIVCETGLYRVGMSVLPVGIVVSLFGLEAVGPTQIILLAMISVVLALEMWETPLAYMTTGLELSRRMGARQATFVPGLMTTAVAGFAVALVVTLSVQYHFGMLGRDEAVVERRAVSSMVFSAQTATELASREALADAVDLSDMDRLGRMAPSRWGLGWAGLGAVLFVACAVARYRLPWWPVHPIMFVLLGNWGLVTFGVSFLLGWLVKSGVVGVAGARGYHQLLPMMCGIIAGGLFSAAIWMVVGIVYFIQTGLPPATYVAF